jgi:hypothetical protein
MLGNLYMVPEKKIGRDIVEYGYQLFHESRVKFKSFTESSYKTRRFLLQSAVQQGGYYYQLG